MCTMYTACKSTMSQKAIRAVGYSENLALIVQYRNWPPHIVAMPNYRGQPRVISLNNQLDNAG